MQILMNGRIGVKWARWGAASILALFGCSGAVESGAPDTSGTGDIAQSAEELHSTNTTLAWIGAAPQQFLQTTNVGALQVIYGVSVGVNGGKRVVGLNVCWYAPTNPNNQYTPGDQTACSVIGDSSAQRWYSQRCDDGWVMSGYEIATNGNGVSGNQIARFGTTCMHIATGATKVIPAVGDSNPLIISQLRNCPRAAVPRSFVESFRANDHFTGASAACVLP